MQLSTLIDELPLTVWNGGGAASVEVREVVEDSRRVGPGGLFVARPGHCTDGRQYIADAVGRGAVAVLVDADTPVVGAVTLVPTGGASVATLAAVLAERLQGCPSRHLCLVGVTGTNGKTTTAHLVHQLCNAAGLRCGVVGTVAIDDGAGTSAATLTTPPPMELSPLLRRMVDNGCKACVMEVSSHALAQDRAVALQFDGAVFTNLSGDHLDYHRTMDAYRRAKSRLFAMLPETGWAVINSDDPAADAMAAATAARLVRCRVGAADDHDAHFRAIVNEQRRDGTDVTFIGPFGSPRFRLPLLGRHNVANALEAAAVAFQMGLDGPTIVAGLEQCEAPAGRLEPVTDRQSAFTVLVDYAHTDDALENVLTALRPLVPAAGRLRVVFGCGGDRDRSKRPRMAQAAWRHADEVIITSDNPRTEVPDRIIDDAWAGVPVSRRACTQRITDRRTAVETAVAGAGPGDVVLIAGKGHEDYQIVGDIRHHFDDRLVARAAIDAIGASDEDRVGCR